MENGLMVKYNVFDVEDGGPVEDCFVLRPNKDPAAMAALYAYAAATKNAELGRDIREWLGVLTAASDEGDSLCSILSLSGNLKRYADKEPKREAWVLANLCSCTFCEVMGIDNCGKGQTCSCTDYIHTYLCKTFGAQTGESSGAPAIVTAHWLPAQSSAHREAPWTREWTCSHCRSIDTVRTRFCGGCGAHMRDV